MSFAPVCNLLEKYFNLEEIRRLCFDLGIEYENLAGDTRSGKCQSLVEYCLRHDRLADLETECHKQRPKVTWPDMEILAAELKKVEEAITVQEGLVGILPDEQIREMLAPLRQKQEHLRTQLIGDRGVQTEQADVIVTGDNNTVQTIIHHHGQPSEATPDTITAPIPDEEWERRYLAYLIGVCGHPPSMALVDIKEAGLGGQKLALAKIFTALDVPVAHREHELAQMTGEIGADDFDKKQRESALTAMSRPENKRLVILGAPGSGKSTLVDYLTLCLAGDQLAREHGVDVLATQAELEQTGWQLSAARLWPLRVVLREYAARGLSQGQRLWPFIEADLGHSKVALAEYAPILRQRLEREGGILLLDGLDEVDKAPKVREALKQNIELFARDFGKVQVVVTSRPYAYGSGWELRDFQVTRLLPFNEEQIQFFVSQWYRVMGEYDPNLGSENAELYSQSLIRQVERIDNLRQMANHPLLLTMMVYIHRGREGGALPHRREELYRLCVILLLDLWRRSKTIPGQETKTLVEMLGMDVERLQAALAEVAFRAHEGQAQERQTADIAGSLLAGTLFRYKSKSSPISLNDIIEYVRDRAGLLEDHGRNANDSDDIYRFPHRTFQEYLAAKHLLNQPDFPHEIVQLVRADATRWREAVLLAGAAAQPALRWALVDMLCDDKEAPPANQPIAEADAWGAFLAGQVVLENELHLSPPPIYAKKVMRVQRWHKAIVAQAILPPRDRALLGQALAALGDDRPGVGVKEKDGILIPDIAWGKEVPAGTYTIGGDERAYRSFDEQQVEIKRPYRLAHYPITYAQFQCFIDAPDVADKAWWADMPAKARSWGEQAFPFANHPRERVSWYEAVAFCRWLSDKLGYTVALPHEYEWEVAARYNDGRFYPWGNQFDENKANTNEGEIGQTTAVGLYPSGKHPELDLYGLSGNVWEWCRNKYNNPKDDKVDDSGSARVLRGGSFGYDQRDARAAYRNSGTPQYRGGHYGFRLVCVRFPSHPDH